MKIMNAEGRYVDKSPERPLSKNPTKVEKYCSRIYSAYYNLMNKPQINDKRACQRFIGGLSYYVSVPKHKIRKEFKHLMSLKLMKNQNSRAQCIRILCARYGFHVERLKPATEDYQQLRSKQARRGRLQSEINVMRLNREDWPELFYGSSERYRYPELCYELKHGHPRPKSRKQHKKSKFSGIRIDLANLGSKKRYRFVGTFVRCGFKSTYHGNGLDRGDCYMPTLLLKDVKLAKTKQKVTDHLWFNYTKGFRRLGMLKAGDKVLFNARVSSYLKGYGPVEAKTRDYDLSFPTKVARPKKVKRPKMPVDDKNSLIGYVMKKNKKFYLMNDRPYDSWYVKRYINWRNLK